MCEVGKVLADNNYRIKIFNTINFKKSMHYNPFAYIHDEKDILKLVTALIANTKGEGIIAGRPNCRFNQRASAKLLTKGGVGYE